MAAFASSSSVPPFQEEPLLTCRICLDECVRAELIAPCQCRGGSKWVHRECLNKWRSTREDRAFSKCTECLAQYVLVARHAETDSEEAKGRRFRRYALLVARDVFMALVTTQLLIWGLTGLTYGCDGGSHSLLKKAHMASHPILFYYLFGIFLFLAIIGLFFILSQICGSASNHDCQCRNHDCPFFYMPGDCCVGCPQCGECGALTGAECSAECAPFVLVVVALLAIIGIFVAAFAGVAFITKVTSDHLHILQKQGLAQDFIVRDLAADNLEAMDNYNSIEMMEQQRHSPSAPLAPISSPHQYTVLNPVHHLGLDDSFDSVQSTNGGGGEPANVSASDRRMLVGLGLM